MDVRSALKSQYRAALNTLLEAVEKCPEDRWLAEDAGPPCWRIAYHALFYTHFYLQRDHESFTPWAQHRESYNHLGGTPWPPHEPVVAEQPYSQAEIVAYGHAIEAELNGLIDAMDLDATECGFPWYPIPKLDHQLVNLRHLQHHAAQLGDRLRAATGEGLGWHGRG